MLSRNKLSIPLALTEEYLSSPPSADSSEVAIPLLSLPPLEMSSLVRSGAFSQVQDTSIYYKGTDKEAFNGSRVSLQNMTTYHVPHRAVSGT